MTHLKVDKGGRAAATPPEWLHLGQQLGEITNKWADRGDIIAYVGPGAGQGAPACFNIPIAEMEVNIDLAFQGALPKHVGDMRTRAAQFEYPVAAGATLHEAMHARHSLFSLPEVGKHEDPRVQDITMMLEETRIENRGVRWFPRNRSFLRACAMHLVMGDLNPDDLKKQGAYGVARLVALTLARVDAGVLEPEDVEAVKEIAVEVLTQDTIDKLQPIWIRAQEYDLDDQHEGMVALGEEFLKVLVDDGHTPEKWQDMPGVKTIVIIGMPPPGEGDSGEGGGSPGEEGEGELSDEMKDAISKALEDAAADTELDARSEGTVQEGIERAEEMAKAAASAAEEKRSHEEKSAEVFGKGTGPVASTRTRSRLQERRDPTGEERAAAVRVGQMLEKARYMERVVTTKKSTQPPGRLKSSVAVQGQAERARAGFTKAEPWRHKRRHHVQDPNLTVGVLVDISGSRGHAVQHMGVLAWVMAESARRIDAEMAMVYYGDGVFPVLAPRQRLPQVNVYTAPDGTERFNRAFMALDGKLNLLQGTGARLLVISSDMYYTAQERAAAKMWIGRLVKAGVGVMITSLGDNLEDIKTYEKLGAVCISQDMKVAQFSQTIGKAMVQALEHANKVAQSG